MRGVYSLLLVSAFFLLFVSLLMRYASIGQANKALIWYMREKSWEFTRRDMELSVRRALEYAVQECDPPTNHCIESRARMWLEMLRSAWESRGYALDLDPSAVSAHVVYDPASRVYIARVSLTSPVDGNVGRVLLHIPAGYQVEAVGWSGG